MRLIKMFGLAAIAAVAAMAFVGASSAMATSTLLCLNDTLLLSPSSAECSPVLSVHFLTVSVSLHADGITELTVDARGKLLANPEVQCETLLSGNVLDHLVTNGPVRILVEPAQLVYSNCTNFCSVTSLNKGELLLLKTAPELGVLTGHGFKVNLKCPFINCDYNAEGLSGEAKGALYAHTLGKGHVTYLNSPVTAETNLGGLKCPTQGLLDALFQSLTKIYIRS